MKKLFFLSLLIYISVVNSNAQQVKMLYTKEGVRYTYKSAFSEEAKEDVKLEKEYNSYLLNGLDLMRVGDYQNAINHFNRISSDSKMQGLSLMYTILYNGNKSPKEFVKQEARLRALEALYKFSYGNIALCYYMMKDYEKAIDYFNAYHIMLYTYINYSVKYLYNDKLGILFDEGRITCAAIYGNMNTLKKIVNHEKDFSETLYVRKLYNNSKNQALHIAILKLYVLAQNKLYISAFEERIENETDIDSFGWYLYYRCCEREAYNTENSEEERKVYKRFSEMALKKLQETGKTQISEIISDKIAVSTISYMEGKWYFDNNFYDKAEKCFLEYEKVFSFNQTPIWYRAEIAEKQGYYKDAFDLYNSIKKLYFNTDQIDSIKKSMVKNLELHEKQLKKWNISKEDAEKEKNKLGSWKAFYNKYK